MGLLDWLMKKPSKEAEEEPPREEPEVYSGMRVEVTDQEGKLLFVAKLQGFRALFQRKPPSGFSAARFGAVVVCCVQLLLSLLIRSFAVPIGIALAGGILGLYMTNHDYGMNYPYSIYCLGMRANNPNMEISTLTLIVNSIGYIAIFAALSVFYLRKHEISAN